MLEGLGVMPPSCQVPGGREVEGAREGKGQGAGTFVAVDGGSPEAGGENSWLFYGADNGSIQCAQCPGSGAGHGDLGSGPRSASSRARGAQPVSSSPDLSAASPGAWSSD